MEQILQTGMERRYGTGVWNGCGPGPCSGPYNLTCTHICMYNHLSLSLSIANRHLEPYILWILYRDSYCILYSLAKVHTHVHLLSQSTSHALCLPLPLFLQCSASFFDIRQFELRLCRVQQHSATMLPLSFLKYCQVTSHQRRRQHPSFCFWVSQLGPLPCPNPVLMRVILLLCVSLCQTFSDLQTVNICQHCREPCFAHSWSFHWIFPSVQHRLESLGDLVGTCRDIFFLKCKM